MSLKRKRGSWGHKGGKARKYYKKPYGKSAIYYDQPRYMMYRSPRTTMPQEYVTTFRFTKFEVLTNVGALYAEQHYSTNAYDVDPALASTSMPYFSELATMYARFRPLRMTYRVEASNNEAFPVMLQTGYTSEISLTPVTSFAGNPLWKSRLMATKGGMDKAVLKDSKTIVQIAGTRQPLFDDLYTGSTTSSTLNSAGTNYVYVVINPPGATPLTAAGVTIKTQISLTVQLYRPKILSG